MKYTDAEFAKISTECELKIFKHLGKCKALNGLTKGERDFVLIGFSAMLIESVLSDYDDENRAAFEAMLNDLRKIDREHLAEAKGKMAIKL